MVKIYTMVKDEVDIVRDWVIYHGCLFGWNNVYVIDNYSTDGTYESLLEFKDLINISREADYKRKGDCMTELIKKHSTENDTLAFPIDIDEFVVYCDKNSNEVIFNKELILNYINNLPPCRVYKANYIMTSPNNKNGNSRAPAEIDYGNYSDYGASAKSFINTKYFHGVIDHGNHIHCNDYHLTNLVLVHYHVRNFEQLRKKSLNNIIGLGYQSDLQSLKNTLINCPNIAGFHHIHTQINIQENNYSLPYEENPNPDTHFSLKQLKERIIGGFF
jgi:hypothetical protein